VASIDESVTVVVTRTIKVGREAEYEEWLHGVARAAASFPGHLGINVLRPKPPSREWVLVFRYDTVEHLRAWDESRERAEWVARAADIAEKTEVQRLSGLEAWFVLPGGGAMVPPPRWKMALVTWCVAFPTIQILTYAVVPLLAPLPRIVGGAILGAGMVLSMTYVLMPLATRVFARFLYPSRP
jgi:antibiotic biosynthesis monooxygenase (ABM) superfamily enzyme